MLDGVYRNPTIIYFGKSMMPRLGEEIAKYSSKVLIHFGTESFKKYGLSEKITGFLKASGVNCIELGGVRPNPRAELVYEGIGLCRKEKINFILAVGGGSVIDSAKAISLGVPYDGDFFDFFEGKSSPQRSLAVATVLTIPGSGSESNMGSVITHTEKQLKLSYAHPLMFPLFSMLNPEVTYTVSAYDTACGITDAVTHVLERYFTRTTYVDCTDGIAEALIKTLMKYAFLVKDAPSNYDIRAEIMWAAKLAHDNTVGFGRKQDWSSHMIAHELGALYDIPHGALLSVIFLAWMRYVYKADTDRFAQFARTVFDIHDNGSGREAAISAAIDKLKQFFTAIGMPVRMSELGIKDRACFEKVSRNCVRSMPSGTIGNFTRLSPGDIVNILEISCV